MLSLQGPLPEVSFQDKSEGAYEKLLELVKEKLPKDSLEQDKDHTSTQSTEYLNEEQKNTSFQVCHTARQ